MLDASVWRRWPSWCAALTVGVTAGAAAYQAFRAPIEPHDQLIFGAIAGVGGSKFPDFLALWTFVGVCCGFLVLVAIFAALGQRALGRHAIDRMLAVLGAAALPAVIMAAQSVLGAAPPLSLVYLATAGVGVTAVFAVLACFGQARFTRGAIAASAVAAAVAATGMAAASAVGLLVAINRAGLLVEIMTLKKVLWTASIAGGIAAFAIAALWQRRPGDDVARLRATCIAAVIAQLGIPLLACVTLDPPVAEDEGVRLLTWRALAIVAIAALIAYAELGRRLRRVRGARVASLDAAVALSSLVFLVAVFKIGPAGGRWVSGDDFHFGEIIVPWWSLAQHGLVPFVDLTPARGFFNYLGGMLNAVLLDGEASSFYLAWGVLRLIFYAAALPLLARVTGKLPAFVGLLLLDGLTSLYELDLMIAAALALLCSAFVRWSPSAWIVLWGAVGVAAVVFAPGQGGLLVLATMPLGIAAAWIAMRREPRRLLAAAFAGALLAGAVLAGGTMGEVVRGAVRYGAEQSSINAMAHAVPWWFSFGSAPRLSVVAFEGIRMSWLLVAVLAGLAAAWGAMQPPVRRLRVLAVAVPILLLTVLFVVRAAGRIDPGWLSRPGWTSLWAATLLLPMLLAATFGRHNAVNIAAVVALAGGVLAGGATSPLGLERVLNAPLRVHIGARRPGVPTPVETLPNLGPGQMSPENRQRLLAIADVTARVLAPGETFLDLTNRGAHYFHLDRPPPIEVTAPYNLVHDRQQLRAVERLRRSRVPLVIAQANNALYDGGPISLRAHLLYRFALAGHVPFAAAGITYLVAPDRLERLVAAFGPAPDAAASLALLDDAFLPRDLGNAALTWGRSPALAEAMRIVHRIPPADIVESASTVLRLAGPGVRGRDAGLLALSVACDGPVSSWGVRLRVSWPDPLTGRSSEAASLVLGAVNGPLLVPLDAAPRWLLAERITELRIEAVDPTACRTIRATDVFLAQRRLVDEAGL